MTPRTLTIADAARHGSELPTAQRLAKAPSVRVTEAQDGTRAVWLGDDSALGKLARHGKIKTREYEAGVLFREDWYIAVGPGVRSQSYQPPVCGGSNDNEPAHVVDARKRVLMDRDRMGEKLFNMVVAVCGNDEAPSDWAAEEVKRRQVGVYLIGIALDRLAFSRKIPY